MNDLKDHAPDTAPVPEQTDTAVRQEEAPQEPQPISPQDAPAPADGSEADAPAEGAPEKADLPLAPDEPAMPDEPVISEAPAEAGQPVQPAAPEAPPIPDRAAIDQEYTDRAADPSEYETYESLAASLPGGAPLHLFAASRIGVRHLAQGTPCQDACLYRVIPHGAVLADADGISACDRSETGSRQACLIAADAVEEASRQLPGEEAFIRRLCSEDFYVQLRTRWVESVKAHWAENGGSAAENPLSHYGTTLLVAVITENWYVTLNLGDGQILLFNDLECMKAQLVDKESQAPSSLIYDDYLEDVRRGVWPRRDYQGIAVMTDGMHDRIGMLPWYACREYAKQTAQRFMEHGAPVQPFIYTGDINGVQRTFDVSRQRSASDDFSIVMAVNGDHDLGPVQKIHDAIQRRLPQVSAIQLLRRVGKKCSFMIRQPEGYRILLAVPDKDLLLRDTHLAPDSTGVKIWEETECWQDEGYSFAVYPLPAGGNSLFLEEEAQEFRFKSCRQYHSVPDTYDPMTGRSRRVVEPLVCQDTVRLHLLLGDLKWHLRSCNLRLNEMAFPWILRLKDPDGTLLVPREVLSEADAPKADLPWYPGLDQLSPALLGYLSARNEYMAVFSPGAAVSSEPYYLFGAEGSDPTADCFFRVVRNPSTNAYGIRNISSYSWLVTARNPGDQDVLVAPNQAVSFADGRKIRIMDGDRVLLECSMTAR